MRKTNAVLAVYSMLSGGPRPVGAESVFAEPVAKKQSPKPPKKNRNSRKRYNAIMKIVRRLHMYFGLGLTPFVLLYGITAMLFNHPTWFRSSTSTTVELAPDTFDGITFEHGTEIADLILQRITEHHAESDETYTIERDRSVEPHLTGDLFVDLQREDERARYRVSPSLDEGSVRVTRTSPRLEAEDRTPFPRSVGGVAAETLDEISERIREHGSASDEDRLTIRSTPDIKFHAIVDGKPWVVSCDLRTGDISAHRAGEMHRDFALRSFLTRLHVSHGYPSEPTLGRWAWAVFVDLTAVMMIFWAISGAVMWWQLKPTRRTGMLATVAGIAVSGVVGYAMLRLLYY